VTTTLWQRNLIRLLADVDKLLPDDLRLTYPVKAIDHNAVMSELLTRVEWVQNVYDGEYGPLAGWPGGWTEETWGKPDVRVWVFDEEVEYDDDDLCYEMEGDFDESSLGRAGRAYRRESGWDFAPGEAGVWVAAYLPTAWTGGSDKSTGWLSGNLVSFAVLHDRDHDGEVESLAHLWTARCLRRQGFARAVVERSRERFPISYAEGPATDDGLAFAHTVMPDLLQRDEAEA